MVRNIGWIMAVFVLAILATSFYQETKSTTTTIQETLNGLVERTLSGSHPSFQFEKIQSPKGTDTFEIEDKGAQLIIRGNNGVSMARGFQQYLRDIHHTSVSWQNQTNIHLSDEKSSRLETKINGASPYTYRYFLNYCTYSYSMAYWDWKRWEKEIDWMAMQGINMPLVSVIGQQAVWQNTLRRLGYGEKEIYDFLPGPGYEAWWLMGNLEGAGGPITQSYINHQVVLQRRIIERMRSYGMEPVFQGFYGMVPTTMKKKMPSAKIKDMGKWVEVYQRPAFLDPADPYFQEVAMVYYQEQEKLFGKARFFGGDPFHEGGIQRGINVSQGAANIYKAMKNANPAAVWILQGWQKNPTEQLLNGLQPGQAIILDLMACTRPQWGGNKASLFHKEKGHLNHPWIWCALPNFGGRIGLYGRFNHYANDPITARQHPLGKNMCGIGIIPEGIETNPVNYDLIFDMAWTKTPVKVNAWLETYAHNRYGVRNAAMDSAWTILSHTVYANNTQEDGPQESIFCARPARTIKHVSSWGTAALYYKPEELLNAWRLMLSASPDLKNNNAYQYDLVDLTRQVLADYGKQIYTNMMAAYDKKDMVTFEKYVEKFQQLILDQDALLSSRREFMLGNWINQARQVGATPQEKNQFEKNAKSIVTIWANVDSDLHDYAHREWSGLLSDYYLERWNIYFDYLVASAKSRRIAKPDFFQFEKSWTEKAKDYPSTPQAEPIQSAHHVFEKYFSEIAQAYHTK